MAADDPVLFVPDASVLLKWVLQDDDEADRDAAVALRTAWLDNGCELVVPTLWLYEVGNVLGLKRPASATALLDALIDLGFTEAPPQRYMSGILRVMRERHVTFYDAAYHALAIHLGGTLITADVRYARRARGAGHIRVLSDWRG